MRQIRKIIVHCSATKEGQDFTVSDIDSWHKARGFKKIGYHYIIRIDGSIQAGRSEAEIGAHCTGHNRDSIGVCYIGGLDNKERPKDTRTEAQKRALKALLLRLKRKYPDAVICGHREFAAKACPCFDAKHEYKDVY